MSDKETFKQELDARTAEIEQLIGTYLPEENRPSEDYLRGNELQHEGWRKAPSPHAHAGDVPAFYRHPSGSCDSLYGGCGDDTHLLSGA